VSGARAEAPEAFDAAAAQYDETFSPVTNPLVRMMRQRALAAAARHFPVGSTLLELGCGTGQDTVELVERGHRIVACDPSAHMLAATEGKVAAMGRAAAVTFLLRGAAALADEWPSLGLSVDGVFSNFGPLNCEVSLEPVRLLLERALRPGGRFVGVVMPKICPLEISLFLARGDVRTAVRRFQRQPIADVEGVRFPIRYYGAGDFDRALGPGFRRIETRSLGLFLPPPRFGGAVAHAPRLLRALAAVEDTLGGLPGVNRMGDHVILVYQRESGV
jgi:ubiquinone/menaquinone biosynthesis C-methylase UbiE